MVSVAASVERFQQQYGSLWRTVEHYLDGTMPETQRCGVEAVVNPVFIMAVVTQRHVDELARAARFESGK